LEHSLQAIREIMKSGQTQRALEMCTETLEANPASVGHLALMGAALSTLGRHAEACDVLRRACDLQPAKAALWFNLGLACEKSGRKVEAFENYSAAVNADPAYEPAQAAVKRLAELPPVTLGDDSAGAYCEAQPCSPVWDEKPSAVCEDGAQLDASTPPLSANEEPTPVSEDAGDTAPAPSEAEPPIARETESSSAGAKLFGIARQKAYMYGGIALLAIVVVVLFAVFVFSRPPAPEAVPLPQAPPEPMMPNPPRPPALDENSALPADGTSDPWAGKVVCLTFDGGSLWQSSSIVLPVDPPNADCPAMLCICQGCQTLGANLGS